MPASPLAIDTAPYRLSGRIYGTLLNHRSEIETLGDAVNDAPYKAPPQAPVLYIKPANTLAGHGDSIELPTGEEALRIGAGLGLVIGRTACRLTVDEAMAHVAGYIIVNDISIPHDMYYRPSVRLKCHDNFCPIGAFAPSSDKVDPDALQLRVYVDDALACEFNTADQIRSAAELLAAVTDFMTLSPGDVLITGIAMPAPTVRAGQAARVEVEGIGTLENAFVEAAA